jgi:hypothetical protein
MIDAKCLCGGVFSLPESSMGQSILCTACNTVLHFATAEELPDGAGAGDFDARLVVLAGPDRVAEHILLGGVRGIMVGKLPDKHIMLGAGKMVSRLHCMLNRLDFGPSRWELIDHQSTNGLFVNEQRIEATELTHGDVIQIGEYKLVYKVDATEAAEDAA